MAAGPQLAPSPDPFYRELREVIAHPADDGARLQYAERCGGARADFIRSQVRLASLPNGLDHPDAPWLAAHSDELLAASGAEWAPAWYRDAGIRVIGYDRGFIECVGGAGSGLDDSSMQRNLIQSAPLRHLDIEAPCTAEEIGRILDSTLGQQIVSLSLDDTGVDSNAIQALVSSKAAKNLRWLSLERNGLSLEAIQLLARLPELLYVYLSANQAHPVERFYEDNGVVVETWMPPEGLELERIFGPLRWLHPPTVDGRQIGIDRMAVGRHAFTAS